MAAPDPQPLTSSPPEGVEPVKGGSAIRPALDAAQPCQGNPQSEDAAYCEFFARYEPPIFGMARKRGLSRHDAEDVVQEVMFAAWRHLDGTVAREGCEHFRGLVLKIAGNKTVDHLRRQLTGVPTESLPGTGGEPVDQIPDTGVPGPAEVYERKVELAVLAECLECCRRDVAPRTFDAFCLYVLEKTPATETAATVDMSVNQVYVTRHQLIDRLRRLMPPPA